MDGPPSTSERKRELAELRSRAYGPDADIDRDADALARLIELEKLARTDAPSTDASDADADGSSDGRANDLAESSDPAGADAPAAAVGTSRRWWRRVPIWAYIAAAGAIGLGLGLAVSALAPPHPVTTLRPVPFVDGVELDFQMYGISAESPVRYEPFHDLEVWSAATEEGSTCVVITTDNGEWMAAGCAPEPLSPTADINFYPGMRQIEGLDLADGSVVRFTLRGDVMEVWLAEGDEAA